MTPIGLSFDMPLMWNHGIHISASSHHTRSESLVRQGCVTLHCKNGPTREMPKNDSEMSWRGGKQKPFTFNGTQMCVCTQTPSHIRESLSPTLFETHKCTQARSHKHLVLHLIQPDHEKNTETAPHKFGLSHAQKQGGCLRHPPVSDVACMQTLTQRLWQKMAIC